MVSKVDKREAKAEEKEKAKEEQLWQINEVSGEAEWVLVKVNVDSGAIDSVCGKDLAEVSGIKVTEMSR